MSDQKISQLTGGGAATATDEYVIARSGANYKITGANVAAAATSVGTLSSLTVSGTASPIATFTSSATTAALNINGTNANGWGSNLAFLTSGTAAGYFGTIGSLLGNTTQDLAVYATSGNGFRVYTNGNNLRAQIDSSGNLAVDTNTLYVDAANNRVGIGTASPSFVVDVIGSSVPTLRINDGAASGTRTAGRLLIGASTTLGVAIENSVDTFNDVCSMVFKTTAASGSIAEKMRLDASGNLGLGVTPSAWGGGNVGLQVLSGALSSYSASNNRQASISNGAYNDSGTWKYIYTDSTGGGNVSLYQQYEGKHSWYNAAYGTLGNAISFGDPKMTLDASGRLLQSVRTIASYKWNSWNPSDVTGTSTNASSSGTTDDSEFVTLANSSGTVTVTFDVAGSYLVCVSVGTNHAAAYSFERITTTFGGTATRRNNQDGASTCGDAASDLNMFSANCFLVSATAAQTLTILPTYELTGSGTTGSHQAFCNVTVQYCGG